MREREKKERERARAFITCARTHIHRHAAASIRAHTCFSMHSWARIPLLFLVGADGSWNSAPAKQRVGTGITGGCRVPASAPRDLLCRASPKVAPLCCGLDHWFDSFCLVVLGLHRTHGLVLNTYFACWHLCLRVRDVRPARLLFALLLC